jgi:hypothetical protein
MPASADEVFRGKVTSSAEECGIAIESTINLKTTEDSC